MCAFSGVYFVCMRGRGEMRETVKESKQYHKETSGQLEMQGVKIK